jgi:hypothetical protein
MSLPQTLMLAGYSDNTPPHHLRYRHAFSSTDMAHCIACGTCLSAKNFSWASGDAYAGHCVYRNGKSYWHVPMTHKRDSLGNGGTAVGLAVATAPSGPFTDPIGETLITTDITTDQIHCWDDLGPSVFAAADGRPYPYWGNKNSNYVGLRATMIGVVRNCQFIIQKRKYLLSLLKEDKKG